MIDKAYGISTAKLNGRTSKQVIFNTKLNLDVDAMTSDDLAYSSNINGSFDLWVKTDKKLQQVTNETGSEVHPSWSSDGSSLYFEKVSNGVINIWNVAKLVDGDDRKEAKQVTYTENGARYPTVLRVAPKK